MPLYTRNRPYLGSFATFADFLAAYPNGSGIASLPEDAYAVVRQWKMTFVPNTARNQWRPEGVLVLAQDSTPITNSAVDSAHYILKRAVVPPGLLEIGGELQWASNMFGDASTNTKVTLAGLTATDIAVGAAGQPTLQVPAGGANMNSATARGGYVMGRVIMTAKAAPTFNMSPFALPTGNVNTLTPAGVLPGASNSDSQPIFAVVTGRNSAVAGSSITALDFYCTYRPPQEA